MRRVLFTFALALASGVVSAQDPAQAPAAPAEQAAGVVAEAGAKIDEILEGEEAVLQGLAYSYDPGNRRDPFKSLELGSNRPEIKGPLPEGIAGLLIDEIDLSGIFKTSRGFIAQVVAPNKNKSYLVRVGDQLYDGDVVRISQNEVVFKQIVNDPTVLKPYREVVKKLSP
jgi:Tfp pilus assembly protein PilP